MAALMIDRVPAAAGIVFDRTGWQGLVNILADDRRSFVEYHAAGAFGGPVTRGRVARTQIMSLMNITAALGELLHDNGKAMLWNPAVQRVDAMA